MGATTVSTLLAVGLTVNIVGGLSAPHLLAQAAAGPFGIADATARILINEAASSPHSLQSDHRFVVTIRHAYERLPVAARGAAVVAAFAWAKTYLNSAAFASSYAAARQRAKPAAAQYALSVDEELKKRLDEQDAKFAEMKQAIAAMPASDRAALLASIKEAQDQAHSPEMIQAIRDEILSKRGTDDRGIADVAAQWNATYPADPRVFVKQELERFLSDSANIDFSIPILIFKGPSGAIGGFVGPLEQPPTWIQGECLLAGREMVTAARAAAEAWRKELSQ
jgi:hypothetical protein